MSEIFEGAAGELRRSAIERAGRLGRRNIGIGDATDTRMIEAALVTRRLGIADPVLIGERDVITAAMQPILSGEEPLQLFDSGEFADRNALSSRLLAQNPNRYENEAETKEALLENDLLFGACLVASGRLDGMLAGSLSTTGDVIRAGLRGVGLQDGIQTLSSFFLMDFPLIPGFRDEAFCWAFADCGVVIDPTAPQLADIATATAASYQQLTGEIPRVALLSFSTKGSAHSDSTVKIGEAMELIRTKAPELLVDGELQFDAAVVPSVAARKAKGSSVAGSANVFIFPDLAAGNIAYKIAERLGGARAMGPILQGLRKPFNDLSRGAKVEEIVTMIAITALQASEEAK